MSAEGRDDRRQAVRVGDVLPPLTIPVTRTLIVSGALASRDFQDVHHDAEAAKAKGSPDIFMNILTTNGLVGRYITDHFGPGAALRKVAIRLGAPNYPGDTMVLTGEVAELEAGQPEGATAAATETATAAASGTATATATATVTATVRIVGANALGRHVTGTVTVTVPTSTAPSRTGPVAEPVPGSGSGGDAESGGGA